MPYLIHLGDKPYSSWSLRGRLLFDAFGIAVEERVHRMRDPEFDAYRESVAPARSVPCVEWEEDRRRVLLWDSLAIAETLAERHPGAGHWPEAPDARAAARSLAAEMHSSFGPLRAAAPMNTRRAATPIAVSEAVAADLARLDALWAWARGRWGVDGPFLFGAAFTAADAFFAPVAYRIAGYALPVARPSRRYAEALLAHPAVARWRAEAAADERFIDYYEAF